MSRIRIEDLPPGDEHLTPEELEQIEGAGRASFRPTLEGLEDRQLLDAGLPRSLLPATGTPPARVQHLPTPAPQILNIQQAQQVRQGPGQTRGQQVADLSRFADVRDALKAGANWIIYEPITSTGGQRVSEAQIRRELKFLYDKGFRGLVTYSFLNGREEIPRIAKEIGFQKVIAGLWATKDYATEKANLLGGSRLKYIDGLCVGNETQGRRIWGDKDNLTFDQLKARVNEIKQLSSKPTTTADSWDMYLPKDKNPKGEPGLMQLGDWVFPNLHPFYEPGYVPAHQDPAKGIDFLKNVLKDHFSEAKVGKGRLVALHESWWPSAQDGNIGDPTYRGSASLANQKKYFDLLNKSGIAFVYGEAFDQSWKANEGSPDQLRRMGRFGNHWGLWQGLNIAKGKEGETAVDVINFGYRPGYTP
jgi:exo-beta-1,3-glucanase (GH17 family)